MKIPKYVYHIIAVVSVMMLLCSAIVSANQTYWNNPHIPTWQRIYSALGFLKTSAAEDELRITVLDVGKADCVLLQSGDKHVLIDAGGFSTADAVINSLYAADVKRFDCIVATHFDEDHIGGMLKVIREFGCESFWLPSVTVDGDVTYRKLMETLQECGAAAEVATFGKTMVFGNATMKVLSGNGNKTDDNTNSTVCRVTFGNHTFLFMADATAATERQLLHANVSLTADVIKVAHHGSRYSSDADFIAAVDPTYAVISCASDPKKRLPHPDTLQTLKECGATIYRTDLHGEILICSDGTQLTVTGEYK